VPPRQNISQEATTLSPNTSQADPDHLSHNKRINYQN